jgi:hypothetical protein
LPNVEADTYHLVGMDSSLDCAFAFVEEEEKLQMLCWARYNR